MTDPRAQASSRIAGMSRRELIAAITSVGAAAALGLPEKAVAAARAGAGAPAGSGPLGPATRAIAHAATTAPHGSDLGAVEHIVFLMMENRSYDHYFGAYHKGRGFDDHPKHSLGAFAQAYPAGTNLSPRKKLLPFHLRLPHTEECTKDLTHNWGPMHECWNHGRMDSFVRTHTKSANEGVPDGAMTMGYFTRRELPLYWALADHFTLGDAYHCSILGPTHPNRVMSLTGTIDPAGRHGGPITDTSPDPRKLWSCDWPTVQELLEDKGVSWKVYHPSLEGIGAKYAKYPTFDDVLYDPNVNPEVMLATDHVLPYFKSFQDPTTTLHQKAFAPTFPNDFFNDLKAGTLPSVSWIIPPLGFDEHPSASPNRGMWFTKQVIKALSSRKKIWSKTVLFLMYDENDGWFDHVPPPVAPKGTKGEHLTAKTISADTDGFRSPLGLGVRVPFLAISPFTRGGHVTSHLYDHTSQLRLLEERFDIRVDHISAWRRKTVRNLEKSLFLGAKDMSMPALPRIVPEDSKGSCGLEDSEFGGQGPTIPTKQRMPTQHGTTISAKRWFAESPVSSERVPASSGRDTSTTKSRPNHLAHGG